MAKTSDEGERGAARYAQDLALRTLIGTLKLLPYEKRIPAMGKLISRVMAPIVGWDRRVRENLAHVFPDLPQAEVRRMMRQVPDNAGRSVMEMYSAPEFVARIARIEVPKTEALETTEAALNRGQGVIFVTGHFGNYDAPRAWFLSRGHRVGALYNPMRNAYFNEHYVQALTEVGAPTFPRGRQGLGEMVRFLKGGGGVGMVIDQFMGHGETLDFLGKPARTALSAAELALKYKCLLVPIYGIRRENGLDFDIQIEMPLQGDDPVALTQALNDSLSNVVRRHMDQWFWIHRRWKSEERGGSFLGTP